MKIFVTGGSGFIGSHLIPYLKYHGHDVSNFDIKNLAAVSLQNKGTEPIFQDIRDYPTLEYAMSEFQPDVVIHLAALAGVRKSLEDPKSYFDTNVFGTYNVLHVAKELGVKKALVASSSSVYGNQENPLKETMKIEKPKSPYAASKIGTEAVCQYFNYTMKFPTYVFRPFTVYGPNGREDMVVRKLITAALNKTEFEKYGNGETSRGYTHVFDLIEGIDQLLGFDYNPECQRERELGNVFNLGGQEDVKLNKLIEIVMEELGEFPIKEVPMPEADVEHNLADISFAESIIGFAPYRNFNQEIRELCKQAKKEKEGEKITGECYQCKKEIDIIELSESNDPETKGRKICQDCLEEIMNGSQTLREE